VLFSVDCKPYAVLVP